jgi:hypothetical protein
MQINPHAFANGVFPESKPGLQFEYYKTQEDAMKRMGELKANVKLIQPGLGPTNQSINLPSFHAIYRVMVSQEKHDALESSKTLQEVGEASRAELNPHDIRDMQFYVGGDILHPELQEPIRDNNKEHDAVKALIQARTQSVEMFAEAAQQYNTPLHEIDMNDEKIKSTARKYFAADSIVNKNSHPADLAERTMKQMTHQVRSSVDVKSLSQMPDMFAEFQARLDAQPSGISDVERVAIAMDGTLDLMAASAPPKAAPIMQSIQDNVRGVVNDINADIEGRVEGYDDLTPSEREFAKPYLQRLPKEDENMFKIEYMNMTKMEDGQSNPAVSVAATLAAMSYHYNNKGDEKKAAMYTEMYNAAMHEAERDEMMQHPDDYSYEDFDGINMDNEELSDFD